MIDLSVIVLTANERVHIARCMEKLLPLFGGEKLPAGRVFVIDCLSTDGTQEIARSYGAEVIEHAWPGYQAAQLNWALDNLPIKTKWVLRLDADEYLFDDTIAEVKALLPTLEDDVTSLSLSLARAWMGIRVERGVGKVILKRFFRYGIARCEDRKMDEHIVTSRGRDLVLKGMFIDDNLNDLAWWTEKHLGYARREALELLNIEYGENTSVVRGIGAQAGAKRAKKLKYARLPLFWRSFAYFCYRYFLRGGFLEGRAGFTWHFFQGWWYRAMVDAKVWEIKKSLGGDVQKIREYLRSQAN